MARYQPDNNATHHVNTYKRLASVFGISKADEFWRTATYHCFRYGRDFYNALNEIPEVEAHVNRISAGEENGFKHYFGIAWGVPNSED